MSLHVATVYDRERVRTEARLARAAEQSKHEISKLALELLQQRHHAQHVANVENKQRAMALVEDKLSIASAELAAWHDQEVTDLEDAKFALFEEFDKRRVAWAGTIGATALLADETAKHAALIESTIADKLREDNEAQETLQNTISNATRKFGGTFLINQYREQAATSQGERDRIHAEHLASLETSWKVRQLKLENTVRLEKPQHRPARLELEDEYQNRLGELAKQQEAVRLRQKRELETLAEERISAHACAREASEAADADLLDERKRVDEWWNSLLNEATARQQQIDKDEQQALNNIDSAEAIKMAQVQKAAGALEAGMDAVAVEVFNTTDAAEEYPQHTSTAGAAAVAVGPSCSKLWVSEEAPASELETPSDYEGAEADAFSPTTTQTAATPRFSPGIDVHATREEVTRHSVASLVRTPDEPDMLHIDGGFATPSDSPTLILEIESYPPSESEPSEDAGSSCIDADAEVALVVQERSGSPDSAGSDFVEI